MKLKTQSYFVAAIGVPTIALICNSIAQEPQKASRQSMEIPVSKRITNKTAPEPPEPQSPGSGWLQFDNCMVFASESVEIAFQDSGVIASLGVQENEAVGAKQVIANLDLELAKTEKEIALSDSVMATDDATKATDDIELARLIFEDAKSQAEQYATMHAKGNAHQSEYTQKQLAAKHAEIQLTKSINGKRKLEHKANLAHKMVTLSQNKLDRLSLRSPIAGTVTRIVHRPGEWVQAGTTVVQIVRLDEVRVDCFIDDDKIDRTRLKDRPVKVILKRQGIEQIFAGRITSFDPEINAAGQIKVHATVQNQKSNGNWLLLSKSPVTMQIQKPQ